MALQAFPLVIKIKWLPLLIHFCSLQHHHMPADVIMGLGDTEFIETFVLTGGNTVTLHFSVAKRNGLQHWNQQLSWIPWKAQQVCWGPQLEELHVVLRYEASLSVQSSLQPAGLLRWMNIVEDRACCEREF